MIESKRRTLWMLLAVLVFLNLFDLVCTLAWCSSLGIDIELNPFVRQLLHIHPVTLVAYKIAILAAFIAVMRICADHNFRLAFNGTVFVVLIYTSLFCWHLLGPMIYIF